VARETIHRIWTHQEKLIAQAIVDIIAETGWAPGTEICRRLGLSKIDLQDLMPLAVSIVHETMPGKSLLPTDDDWYEISEDSLQAFTVMFNRLKKWHTILLRIRAEAGPLEFENGMEFHFFVSKLDDMITAVNSSSLQMAIEAIQAELPELEP